MADPRDEIRKKAREDVKAGRYDPPSKEGTREREIYDEARRDVEKEK